MSNKKIINISDKSEFYDWGNCEFPDKSLEGGLCQICINGNRRKIPVCKLGKAIEMSLLDLLNMENK